MIVGLLFPHKGENTLRVRCCAACRSCAIIICNGSLPPFGDLRVKIDLHCTGFSLPAPPNDACLPPLELEKNEVQYFQPSPSLQHIIISDIIISIKVIIYLLGDSTILLCESESMKVNVWKYESASVKV